MKEIEVGSEWITYDGSVSVEVIHVETIGSITYVTYRRRSGLEGRGETSIHSNGHVSFKLAYSPKPEFFETGRTYKFKDYRKSTYYVDEVRQIENSIDGNGLFAIATATNSAGTKWVAVLDFGQLVDMEEVK